MAEGPAQEGWEENPNPAWKTDPEAASQEAARRLSEADTRLDLDDLAALDRLPDALAERTDLESLYLKNTNVSRLDAIAGLTSLDTLMIHDSKVADLSPLAGLEKLDWLSAFHCPIEDISPLRTLTSLKTLLLRGTNVRDFRPVAHLDLTDLRIVDTPATEADPELQRLAGIRKNEERTEKLLAYLKTLPADPETPQMQSPAGRPVGLTPKGQVGFTHQLSDTLSDLSKRLLGDVLEDLGDTLGQTQRESDNIRADLDAMLSSYRAALTADPARLDAHKVYRAAKKLRAIVRA